MWGNQASVILFTAFVSNFFYFIAFNTSVGNIDGRIKKPYLKACNNHRFLILESMFFRTGGNL